ncbi:hypothetical protein GSY69_01460 [Brevibacterium sp. 5221]|uniref:FPG-type domain-containing protein n=1 Tax=Brevibacterium rongguiense TaxID=2695267 RepID=A0A6N9H3Q4_9MICO|nr:hypothetical protein [Brevibacterium rongguiense]
MAAGSAEFRCAGTCARVECRSESGYFERSLAVYGRAGEPCRRCGTPIRRLTGAGRASHVCPRCQPVQRLR